MRKERAFASGEAAGQASIRGWAETLGIETLGEWDVLTFLSRRGISLIPVERIASLLGTEGKLVEETIARLEIAGLIQRSEETHGVRLYRFLPPADAQRKDCFANLTTLADTRAGRLLLVRSIRPQAQCKYTPARKGQRFA
jgi:hypothetical protein